VGSVAFGGGELLGGAEETEESEMSEAHSGKLALFFFALAALFAVHWCGST
jgi:hypothetical protein